MAAKQTAITPIRKENFAEWYQEVIKAADLAEHSIVRGCMVMKPWGYGIWEWMQKALDAMIKETDHQNVYFPLLIPLSFLEQEAKHVEGFAKECAVVTHYRLVTNEEGKLVPAPDAQLTEPYIIRPTSEAIIGSAMSKWVQSYNDLPILINQWCNVMRWEMRTRLFLRTAEFLWQEGHTAHATAEEAMEETMKMLNVYEKFAVDYLAVPVIKGEKTFSEKFPGADNTYCIEAMMQDGKALQAGTSHFLGQNFSTAYDIMFTDQNQQQQHVYTTSWGVSTRLIGALIMTHSDDDGLVLPPRIAPQQIILIPVAGNDEDKVFVTEYCEQLRQELKKIRYYDEPIRAMIDKTNRRGGEKFWGAVKKGVPIRIEVGKREIESGQLAVSRRDKAAKEKQSYSREDFLANVDKILDEIHNNLLERALQYRESNSFTVNSLAELEKIFSGDEDAFKGFAYVYFDQAFESDPKVVEKLKSLKLTARCMPLGAQEEEGVCIFSGNKTKTKVILARAY